ncbi:MAG TPA: hypothetical protein PLL26_02390 [Candidatus Dojkabacteria bacterium]|nr:hypothetical protein [Candidatus Dojkabacteria bacterium]
MKKFAGFITMVTIVLFAASAFGGPMDWAADKLGYTPTSKFEAAKAETAKAVAAAKAAEEAAAATAAVAELEGQIIGYGGILILALGGVTYFKRKDLARKILAEKKVA